VRHWASILVPLLGLLAWPVSSRAAVWGLAPRLVMLDPGHGGRDPGAEHGGAKESDINLDIARALARELEDLGVRVVLTRTTRSGVVRDKIRVTNRPRREMEERARLAGELHPDVYLAMHCNAWPGGGTARGAQVFVDPRARPSSVALGRTLSRDLMDYTETRRDLSMKIDHYLLKRLKNETALTLEMGYLTHPGDRRDLTSPARQKRLARIVAMSLVRYLTDIRPPGREGGSGKMGLA